MFLVDFIYRGFPFFGATISVYLGHDISNIRWAGWAWQFFKKKGSD